MTLGRHLSGSRPSRPGGVRWLSPADNISDQADVVVIGGGATGVGVLWDLTLRGFDVVLVEQAGVASGTSGAFHGLLHSGGRYAGSDPETAAECLAESRILKAVAAPFVHDTRGVFVRLEQDDAEWEERWLDGCRASGVAVRPLDPGELLRAEPALSSRIVSAYEVPDAAVDGFGLLWSLIWLAAASGARAYFRARVTGLLTDEDGVRGVQVVGLGGTEDYAAGAAERGQVPAVEPGEITAGVVVNATGPWAAEIAGLAGPDAARVVPVTGDKGTMIIFNAALVRRVVNRLRPPADGDIFVPHGPVTIFGTTSVPFPGRGHPDPGLDEIRLLMDEGRALVPTLNRAPPLRAYAGVRPLLAPASTAGDGSEAGRGRGRGFLLVDHGESGGPAGLVTVAGGKFTTFRAMAEETGDLVCRLLGRPRPCRTSEVGIPRLASDPSRTPAGRAAPARGRSGSAAAGGRPGDLGQPLACECEFVDLPRLLGLLDGGLGLSDLRRVARVGMGGCQGVFCGRRLAGALAEAGWPGDRARPRDDPEAVAAETEAFRRARRAGARGVQWGIQARLGALAAALEGLTLGETGAAGGQAAGGEGSGPESGSGGEEVTGL